ncbi:MAG: AAA family ATPase [Clostridiales bacterium]|nr:AAA family ATPase [Clostridiales bacterium]
MKKRIPIGISDFKEIIQDGYHYIDKSLFIRELLDDGSKVVLLPRPRRFGKTLNMTMLRYFFEKTVEDNSVLFHGLKVWEDEEIRRFQGRYPVIYLTFKDVKHDTWEDCFSTFRLLLNREYGRHRYLLEGELLLPEEKKTYESVLWNKADKSIYESAINNLSEYLYRYYKERAVILIDEYDTPVYSAWSAGYYNDLISFLRNFLSNGLKDNPFLEKSVLTGILRIAKESIFSGLNNLNVGTILQDQYSDKFGFLEQEVEGLFASCGIHYAMPEVRDWYNGYIFGGKVIYNPWSVLNYAHKPVDGLKAYWVNTGGSELIRDLLTRAGSEVKLDLETLILGGELVKVVRDTTVMTEIQDSPETLWSFLLFSGYLKAVDNWIENKKIICRLRIPNKEVEYVFEEIILYWTNKGVQGSDYRMMLKSLTGGDLETFEDILSEQVERSISYFDVGGEEPEKFYHAFVLGMMISLDGEYRIKSNRESGRGRYDIMLIPEDVKQNGIVIEFKKVNRKRDETLDAACEAALRQIRETGYRSELEALGVTHIIEVGIAFQGKEVRVKGALA